MPRRLCTKSHLNFIDYFPKKASAETADDEIEALTPLTVSAADVEREEEEEEEEDEKVHGRGEWSEEEEEEEEEEDDVQGKRRG